MSLEGLKIQVSDIIKNPRFLIDFLNFPIFTSSPHEPLRTEDEDLQRVILESLKIDILKNVIINPFLNEHVDFVYPRFEEPRPESGVGGVFDINRIFEERIREELVSVDNQPWRLVQFYKDVYCNEQIVYSNHLPNPEKPLNNPRGYLCYLNSSLHLLYPVLIDIQNNTNYEMRMSLDLSSLNGDKDYFKNIVNFILETLIIEDNTKRLERVNMIREFLNYELKREGNVINIKVRREAVYGRNGKIVIKHENPFQNSKWAESDEAIITLFDNLMELGYCTTIFYHGIIQIQLTGFNYKNDILIKDASFKFLRITPTSDFNIQEEISKTLSFPMEEREYRIDLKNNKINYQNHIELKRIEVPKQLGVYINDYPHGKIYQKEYYLNIFTGFPHYIFVSRSREFNDRTPHSPITLNNINIMGILYQITDIICSTTYAGNHYISFNKRNIDGALKWILYNDGNRSEILENNDIVLQRLKIFHFRYFLLKRIDSP